MQKDDTTKGYRSLKKYLLDFDYGTKRLEALGLDGNDIHPVMVIAAEARLYGKGKLVDSAHHRPSNPHHSKKDVGDAVKIIKAICRSQHKRQPKLNSDERKWWKQFSKENWKYWATLIAASLIALLMDTDRNGVPDLIDSLIQKHSSK